MTHGLRPSSMKWKSLIMHNGLQHLQDALDKREKNGNLRVLQPRTGGIDFYSNDYLGLAGNEELQQLLLKKIIQNPQLLSGSTGSRLVSGNSDHTAETEQWIAREHRYPSALLFPSGYHANLALFSTVPNRHDTVIADEKIHRSVHDGCTLSYAKKLKFRHNDPEDLERILSRQKGRCYIAIESLYSMDGDVAPIQEIAGVCEKYRAGLIVDEAHAFGIFGYGLADRYQLRNKVLATVITYGKALGMHGAAVLSTGLIVSYLINFASPFIYTTSAPDVQWIGIKTGYDFLKKHPERSAGLQKNIKIFRQQRLNSISSEGSPVQAVLIPDTRKLKSLQKTLYDKGLLTYAVCSPAVKEGSERLRICIHSFNTEEEIIKLTGIIRDIL
ncbi:aminotransferase class I/II-fold pyridoxal phosphate-dependent enzyme [Chryseobacterium sp. JJR-5R]|uniref:aminotransferase class I/II-fold pyridoxal phosphate-dependent enzyme n=1 Tax=Chryseobacterium sp. JJR-5R TaxID=3093923 RepID=UPI002A758341|nr:aminotransferase class I/II-fold pyridoxal phosphate-dependent enzyme [Chryseobacterium sp. JJR-5R]WPO81017.1 aminotransferase class I/II-fold pyridoxal phosphate-dependent enzyme [Chryseobacterium sp. JJR-5R]